MQSNPYSIEFYEKQSGGSQRSAEIVLPLVWSLVGSINNVLDVGCGIGTWSSECIKLGASSVLGLDGNYVDRSRLLVDASAFCPVDFSKVPLPRFGEFDLVLCLEVAEHLPSSSSDELIQLLVESGSMIVFSAAIPGQGGKHHVNEQWPDYWIEKFESRGFEVFDVVRARIWDDERVQSWYKQNLFIFATGSRAEQLRALPVSNVPLRLVHPDKWNEAKYGARSLKQLAHDMSWLPRAAREAMIKLGARAKSQIKRFQSSR